MIEHIRPEWTNRLKWSKAVGDWDYRTFRQKKKLILRGLEKKSIIGLFYVNDTKAAKKKGCQSFDLGT